MFERIVLATDGSENASQALDDAIKLARALGSGLTILTVLPTPRPPLAGAFATPFAPPSAFPYTPEEAEFFRRILADALGRAEKGGVKKLESAILEGDIVDQILGYIKSHPTDLLVVGSRGLSKTGRLLLGSVSDGLVHYANCPVLVHKVVQPAVSSKRRSNPP